MGEAPAVESVRFGLQAQRPVAISQPLACTMHDNECPASIVQRFRVIGILLHKAVVVRESLFVLAAFQIGIRPIDERDNIVRFQTEGRVIILNGKVILAHMATSLTAIVQRSIVLGIESDRLVVVLDRSLVLARFVVGHSPVVP